MLSVHLTLHVSDSTEPHSDHCADGREAAFRALLSQADPGMLSALLDQLPPCDKYEGLVGLQHLTVIVYQHAHSNRYFIHFCRSAEVDFIRWHLQIETCSSWHQQCFLKFLIYKEKEAAGELVAPLQMLIGSGDDK